jgi:hypothetical protein
VGDVGDARSGILESVDDRTGDLGSLAFVGAGEGLVEQDEPLGLDLVSHLGHAF